MKNIVFVDTEVDFKSKKILDIGAYADPDILFRSNSKHDFLKILKTAKFICGHNLIKHDLVYLQKEMSFDFSNILCIDTLYFSPLLFPKKPYHALLKDDKLQTDDLNNPLNDAIKARDLFYDEVNAFKNLESDFQIILYGLLNDQEAFSAFFRALDYSVTISNLALLIQRQFQGLICKEANIKKIISSYPVELAYCLALIRTKSRYSITPPWVIKTYPHLDRIMYLLRNQPCLSGCDYCNQYLDADLGLKNYFGYDAYRSYNGVPLQKTAVEKAIRKKSLLVIFPTGGGKSIAFQVPALMSGASSKGLTVVISPLQSLMKDQVDNLEKLNITEAVTINGLLDPIERAKAFERVENGSASMLYISPESLRSKSIERLLLGRNVVRFVIDEAHCFSSWGQDFRVDYLYIGDFIKNLQEKKNLTEAIPVSCFTATAKKRVIEDIREYFHTKLSLSLDLLQTNASRTNLHFHVIPKDDPNEKYFTIRNLIDAKQCPTIIYVSRTRLAARIAERLCEDGYTAAAFYGKMDKQEKTHNQDAFIKGDIQIMVATSAFGMGVDKKDVGLVIHFDISDSLENYVQEAGRAGRDEKITAECYVLYNDDDLSKHFILLNQTKLNIKEIQQIWKAIKALTRFRSSASNSALEIARKAGWDDTVMEIETRVTTAIAALEEAGYLKRGQNMPRIFATGILTPNAQEAIAKINASDRFDRKQKEQSIRIIKKLISSKSRQNARDESAESRVDYISDHLGIQKGEVIHAVNLMREENILADSKDLTAFIKTKAQKNRSLEIVKVITRIEHFLATQISEEEETFNLKELNERAEEAGCKSVSPQKIRTVLNFWAIKNWIRRKKHYYSKHHLYIAANHSPSELKEKLDKRSALAQFIIEYLFTKIEKESSLEDTQKDLTLVDFSVHELKNAFANWGDLFNKTTTIDEVEDALFYLSRVNALKIEGGFLVLYNKLTIERLEQDNKKRYKNEDYRKLKEFYENKIQQIHIVGEYAKKMIHDYTEALQFVDDYFQLNYYSFLQKHFNADRQREIQQNITPAKFRQLFGELSPTQLSIIKDNVSPHIAVSAGPGSGKTRVLVHKLASLLLLEDVKHEQLLMLTFSRAAATEFKKRLLKLIGNAALYVEIKTFHSYCFDLIGRMGTIEKSKEIIQTAIEKITNNEIEQNRITKTVLVVDEAQDMDVHEYQLLKALMQLNEDMRVIAVGDDDQNIYEFRGASAKHLEEFITQQNARRYELVRNYRSKRNLVDFTNQYVQQITHRLKETPIIAEQKDLGFLKLTTYASKNLITSLVSDILATDLSGTTCILTHTNKEALQVMGLLVHEGLRAQLIHSNDGFNVYNMQEIRFFVDQLHFQEDRYRIDEELWQKAKRVLWDTYRDSSKIHICVELIKTFQLSNPKVKYKTDFITFVRESVLEDFLHPSSESIYVSTMHKSKGKEFDNVFVMMTDFDQSSDCGKRQLYVAMTRAKSLLSIHTNNRFLDKIQVEGLIRRHDNKSYDRSDIIVIQLNHKDIWLDYFISRQHILKSLKSGDPLTLQADGCATTDGRSILRFSAAFKQVLQKWNEEGYTVVRASINYLIYWQKEDTDLDILIALPELKLGRQKKDTLDPAS